jgi:hypothetical protein
MKGNRTKTYPTYGVFLLLLKVNAKVYLPLIKHMEVNVGPSEGRTEISFEFLKEEC